MNILVVGDTGIDIYEKQGVTLPGGIAFNVAVHAARAGAAVALASVFADDEHGKMLHSVIQKEGIDIVHMHTMHGQTPTQRIALDPRGERVFTGYTPGVLSSWQLPAEVLSVLSSYDAVYVPLSDGMEEVFMAIARKQTTAVKVADFSQDAACGALEKVVPLYAKAFDISFIGGNSSHIPLVTDMARTYDEKLFVLTLGIDGAIAFQGKKQWAQPSLPVSEIVDTTGCGDAFQAAFLVSYLDHRDVPKALMTGARNAAQTVGHIGATLVAK